MKGALSSKPDYQFDENGNLVANEGETEEARSLRESIVLYKEGFSANHPADVAASNDPEVSDEPPEQEEPVEGETNEQREAREDRARIKQEAWERKREATRGSQQGEGEGPESERSQANDSNDPSYSRPTTQDEVEENNMEEVEEQERPSSYQTRRPGSRRGR